MSSLAFSSALMVSVTFGAILSISSVTNAHSASSNQHDPQPQQSHRRLLASARGRHGERDNLVKPKTTTTRRAVAGHPGETAAAETVVAKKSSNTINKVIATDLPLNNSEFLRAMDQDHLPMFKLSGYTVLGTSSFPKPSAMAERIPLNESISTASLIVPYLKPVHGAHRATADAVFLFAAEYPLSSYILFIGSLRQTGYDGDIVIAISKLDWNEKEVRAYLSHDPHVIVYAIHFSCFNAEWEPVTSVKGGMRVCQCHHLYGRQQVVEGDTSSIKQRKTIVVPLPDPREPRTIATTRYELYWIWVQAYNPSVWMLLIDARDSWFQTNPFDDLPRQVEGKGRKAVTSGQLYLFGVRVYHIHACSDMCVCVMVCWCVGVVMIKTICANPFVSVARLTINRRILKRQGLESRKRIASGWKTPMAIKWSVPLNTNQPFVREAPWVNAWPLKLI